MIKLKLFTLFFALKNLLIPNWGEKKQSGFNSERYKYKIEKLAMLPDSVLESSGLEIAKDGKSYWTVGDGGTKSQLFEIDKAGNVLSILSLNNLKNIDWEELTQDDSGNLYVCDVGNNSNNRQNLVIYKIDTKNNNSVDTIRFVYADQKNFPPTKKEMNYDCEGAFWYNHNLYLISKNRGNKVVKIYKLPDQRGFYTAVITDAIYINSQITAADISPDNKLVTMLTYGKIYFFKVENENGFKLTPYFIRKFDRSSQSEAIVFINNTDLLITNEDREIFLARSRKK